MYLPYHTATLLAKFKKTHNNIVYIHRNMLQNNKGNHNWAQEKLKGKA
jgi:hypothetical protein